CRLARPYPADARRDSGRHHRRRRRRPLPAVDYATPGPTEFDMNLFSSLLCDIPPSVVRLEARDLSMGYAQTTIIDDLNLVIPGGQVTAIVGPNGCGKSTLLAGLARLHKPSAGQVLLDGKAIGSLPSREVARRLALLPQDA